jgi:hypothetical protein
MPAHPAWFQRLDSILSELRALPADYLDRMAIERLFGVRQRRARQLMEGIPGFRAGNAFAVSRAALIARLERTATGDRFEREVRRRARLSDSLEKLRADSAARRVRLPAAQAAAGRSPLDLPEGVELGPRELRIRFTGAADLAAKLFGLSQAMASDWEGFAAALEKR